MAARNTRRTTRMLWRGIVVGWMVSLLCGISLPAFAAERYPHEVGSGGRLRKLGRGIANIVTSPVELVQTTREGIENQGYREGLVVGVWRGLGRTALRGVVGVFEVVTFFVEVPDGYEPILKPEFVFDKPTARHW